MKSEIILLIIVLSMTTIIAENPLSVKLQEGKNTITINETFDTIHASELISMYPQIESISINEYGKSFGYVNTMGGLGTNIMIEPQKEYEIYSKGNITLEIRN